VPYRKVGYMEQCWYIIRWKVREVFGKEKIHAKKTETAVRVSGLPQSDRATVLSEPREDGTAAVRQKSERPTCE
jgi:hypothetical protein